MGHVSPSWRDTRRSRVHSGGQLHYPRPEWECADCCEASIVKPDIIGQIKNVFEERLALELSRGRIAYMRIILSVGEVPWSMWKSPSLKKSNRGKDRRASESFAIEKAMLDNIYFIQFTNSMSLMKLDCVRATLVIRNKYRVLYFNTTSSDVQVQHQDITDVHYIWEFYFFLFRRSTLGVGVNVILTYFLWSNPILQCFHKFTHHCF